MEFGYERAVNGANQWLCQHSDGNFNMANHGPKHDEF